MRVSINHTALQNILLALLLVSGGIKPFLSYYGFPLDITLILILTIGGDFFVELVRKKITLRKSHLAYLAILALFCLLAFFSLTYTASEEYSKEKVLLMSIPILGFVYPICIKEIRLRLWYSTILYSIMPITLWFIVLKFLLYNPISSLDFLIDRPRFMDYRQDYLNLGYLLAILIILSPRYSNKPILIMTISTILMLGLGSRGSLIFILLASGLIYSQQILGWLKKFSLKKKTIKRASFSLLVILVSAWAFYDTGIQYLRYGISRFSSLFQFNEDNSTAERLEQYAYALEGIFTSYNVFFGYGIGSWGFLYLGVDGKAYPHNIFLESWFELGILGFLLLLLLFFTPLFLRRPKILKVMAFFAVLNALKSSSFAYDRNLFIIYGILIFGYLVVPNKKPFKRPMNL